MRYRFISSLLAAVGIVGIGWVLAHPFMVPGDVATNTDSARRVVPTARPSIPPNAPALSSSEQQPRDARETSPLKDDGEVPPEGWEKLIAELPPIAANVPMSDEVQVPQNWVLPKTALDILIEQGPDVWLGPAEELVPLAASDAASDGRQPTRRSWRPDPDAPLPSIAQFELTRLETNTTGSGARVTAKPVLPSPQPTDTPSSLPDPTANPSGDVSNYRSFGMPPVRPNSVGPAHWLPPEPPASPFDDTDRLSGMSPEPATSPGQVVLQPELHRQADR